MSVCDISQPVPVTCNHWYFLPSSKQFSSSTITFHHKIHHLGQPLSLTPDEIQCRRCLDLVPVTRFAGHFPHCAGSTHKSNSLVTIPEESTHLQCTHCRRTFERTRFLKHQTICEVVSRKRPIFDMAKRRSPAIRENLYARITHKKPITLHYPQSNWQKRHINLLRNLRAMPNSHSLYEDYIQCPHCQRQFAPGPAEKHIEKCKDIIHKPKPPPGLKLDKNMRTQSLCNLSVCSSRSVLRELEAFPKKTEENETKPVQCTQCGKSFAPRAGKRHMELCNNSAVLRSVSSQRLNSDCSRPRQSKVL